MLKVDIFNHIIPPEYKCALFKMVDSGMDIITDIEATPTVFDLDERFRIMERFESQQVITIASPPIEEVANSANSPQLARIANEGLARLVDKYPDRFLAGVASLPMNNIEAALEEIDYAIKVLNLRGIQLFTPTNDRPLDTEEFMDIYRKMAEYDLPIWVHPYRRRSYPDYWVESEPKYRIFSVFGWPFETTVAMARIVFSGILDKWPNLKFIFHHCGGMVPFFRERIIGSYERIFSVVGDNFRDGLKKEHHIDYFKQFYADTAIGGNTSALMCAYEIWGAEHLLFGTDMPFDTENGAWNLRNVSQAIEQMAITTQEKKKIFYGNAIKLLNL